MDTYYKIVESGLNAVYLRGEASEGYTLWDRSDDDTTAPAWVSKAPSLMVVETECLLPRNCTKLFAYGTCTTVQNMELLNTSRVTDMSYMFVNTNGNYLSGFEAMENWDTHNVEKMNNMFQEETRAEQLKGWTTLNLNNWDVSKVKDFSEMFANCDSLYDLQISNWNTESAEDMSYMFTGDYLIKSLDLSNWNVGNVKNFDGMLQWCGHEAKFTTFDVSKWDTHSATSMYSLFSMTLFSDLDVSNWDVSNVTTFKSMFSGCTNLQSLDLRKWDMSSATDVTAMFGGCKNLTSIKANDWRGYTNITKSDDMFYNAQKLPNYYDMNVPTIYRDDIRDAHDHADGDSPFWRSEREKYYQTGFFDSSDFYKIVYNDKEITDSETVIANNVPAYRVIKHSRCWWRNQ